MIAEADMTTTTAVPELMQFGADSHRRGIEATRAVASALAYVRGLHHDYSVEIEAHLTVKTDEDGDESYERLGTTEIVAYVLADGDILARTPSAYIVQRPEGIFWVDDNRYDVDIILWASDYDAAKRFLTEMKEKFEQKDVPVIVRKATDPKTWINVWLMTGMGAESFNKRLAFPSYESIKDNYSTAVQNDLAALMASKPEKDSGILVWTGPPGTGKTTAIRSLAREWAGKVKVHIISDTEVFLSDPSYLLRVGMQNDESANLIVLEDAGELLISDGEKGGQALSRLLNFTDGILGQGMNVYFLLTTNEEFEKLHGAVTRPGRAVPHGVIHFGNLTADESNAWLAKNNVLASVTEESSLAQLYELRAKCIESGACEAPEVVEVKSGEFDAEEYF